MALFLKHDVSILKKPQVASFTTEARAQTQSKETLFRLSPKHGRAFQLATTVYLNIGLCKR